MASRALCGFQLREIDVTWNAEAGPAIFLAEGLGSRRLASQAVLLCRSVASQTGIMARDTEILLLEIVSLLGAFTSGLIRAQNKKASNITLLALRNPVNLLDNGIGRTGIEASVPEDNLPLAAILPGR